MCPAKWTGEPRPESEKGSRFERRSPPPLSFSTRLLNESFGSSVSVELQKYLGLLAPEPPLRGVGALQESEVLVNQAGGEPIVLKMIRDSQRQTDTCGRLVR